ncbi:hypothetical protein T11_11985 [Trichinella zimbabwensis]|uniref:Uncharacterized protein n=1 Tax=Trichinella zimbabwensis TaxID=268475 RepID=A0A0V1HMF2_9BILA|nr:hypothetical protein T11_11985 [Trichinella zimbabwensis]
MQQQQQQQQRLLKREPNCEYNCAGHGCTTIDCNSGGKIQIKHKSMQNIADIISKNFQTGYHSQMEL